MTDDTSSAPRQHVHMFWTGPSLSSYEHLSLKSFVATGANVSIYSYDKNLAVPEGVELVYADEIIPPSNFTLVHLNGEPSLVSPSNLFRYAAIEKLGGWYADLDMVCLGKSLPDRETYLARETNWSVNAAVMKFPMHHPIVEALLEECRRVQSGLQDGSIKPSWGVLGPTLVTTVVTSQQFNPHVLARLHAYEIGYDEVLALFDPQCREKLSERTRQSDFVHLWNEVWRSLKIPKLYGPPAGSYLDSLFRRFEIEVPKGGRLSYDAIVELFRERQLITDVKYNLKTERLPLNAADKFIRWATGSEYSSEKGTEPKVAQQRKSPPIAESPQRLQTFWHGSEISPYQLLCLRSFVEHGHQVEVFTYEENPIRPEWLVWSDASAILPRDRVLIDRPNSQVAILSSLFRCSLLSQRGGWWIDPDVVLVNPNLPQGEVFHAGLGDFELISPAVLKFPKHHPTVEAVLNQTIAESFPPRDPSGATVLTQVIRRERALEDVFALPPLSRLSWLSIAELFDPERASELEQGLHNTQFLQLHIDAWKRAGIPMRLGPPEGSLLDRLFRIYDVGSVFPARSEFGDVRRWISNMYSAMREN